MKENILIIAPHPDDEVLGCGGVMRLYANDNHNVYVLIVTRGTARLYSDERIKLGRSQALQAHSILGVTETFFLDFPAPELDTIPIASISESIADIISKLKISMLFIPHRGDIHIDHLIVFNAAIVSARPVGDYSIRSIFAYETLSETEWAAPYSSDIFIPNHFVNIGSSVHSKLEAMSCYSGQLRKFPNPRSLEAIESLARFRGSTISCDFAEAFMSIRTIIK